MLYRFVLHIQGRVEKHKSTRQNGQGYSGLWQNKWPMFHPKGTALLRSRKSLPCKKAGPSLWGDTRMLPRPVCQVRMEIQIIMLNVLVLKFWQLMEAYAGNSDYLVTRHIVTVFDIFFVLYLLFCNCFLCIFILPNRTWKKLLFSNLKNYFCN